MGKPPLMVLAFVKDGLAHQAVDAAAHQDPELLGSGWAQAHMFIQWIHL